MSEDTATRIFDRLDQRHDGHLSRDEFEGLVDALRNEASRPWTSEDRPASEWRASIGELVASRNFEYVVDGLLVANAVVVALQTRPQLMGKAPKEEAPDDPLELVETGLAVVYALSLTHISEPTRRS